jgi:uncharacterized membrane protein YccC
MGMRDACSMDWEPIVAVLIFIAGLAWNRHDTDRRERRAARAAASAAFEQLQRETHLELQDAIWRMHQASLAPDETRREEFRRACGRADVLESRLADPEAWRLAHLAIYKAQMSVARYVASHRSEKPMGTETYDEATVACDAAVLYLGGLLRKAPDR